MIFPKYEYFEKQYNKSSLTDYESFLQLELARYYDEGKIDNINEFKARSERFWLKEKKNVEPNYRIVNLFLQNNTILDSYIDFQKNTNIENGKQLQVLTNVHRQFITYKTVALENALATNNSVSFQAFTKLPSITRKETIIVHKGTQHEFEMKQWENIRFNKLILETKDVYRRFFTSIPGLREEVNQMLSKIIQINVSDVYDNNQQQWCQSFGSHHIFQMYADKVFECIQSIKDKMYKLKLKKDSYQCICGCELKLRNKLYHEKNSSRHQMFV